MNRAQSLSVAARVATMPWSPANDAVGDGSEAPVAPRTVFDELAENSPHLWRRPLGTFGRDGRTWELPAYLFLGPKRDAAPLRLAVFAGIAGDEIEGSLGLARFVTRLVSEPVLATGLTLYLYPNCNPTGLDRQQRETSGGVDLARQLWTDSRTAETALLTREIRRRQFHGWVTLHSHRLRDSFQGFAGPGETSQSLVGDLLPAVCGYLPAVVSASGNTRCGFLRPPISVGSPFTLRLSTPRTRPLQLQLEAVSAALTQLLGLCRAAHTGSSYLPPDHARNTTEMVHL